MLCIHRFETLGSTNTEAIRLAREGAEPGTVVWAEGQTAGRGRMGRDWTSDPGNAHLSVVVRPTLPIVQMGRISVACGLGLADALRNDTWHPVRTKWPNDLYLYGRKVGGILVETGAEWAVVGVGVNVAGCPDVPPPGRPATCLAAHGGVGNLQDLIPSLANAIVTACGLAETSDGWESLSAKWRRMDLAMGDVRVFDGGGSFDAKGDGIDIDGALLVRVGGDIRRVTAGDVSIRV